MVMIDKEKQTQKPFKIVILGAGAMGSFFGAMLAHAHEDVTLIDVDEAHLDAINKNGLLLHFGQKNEIIKDITAIKSNALDFSPDLVIVFTKTNFSAAALDTIKHRFGPQTYLLSLQNGLGNDEVLRRFVDERHAMIGMTTWPAVKPKAGFVEADGEGIVHFYPLDSQADTFADLINNCFNRAGLNSTVDPQIHTAIWQKVAFNACLNTLCAVTGATVGELGDVPEIMTVITEVVGEISQVAGAKNIAFNVDETLSTIRYALANHKGHKPSMLQDIENGRATEIMTINGKIAEYAYALGIKAPCNDLLKTLVLVKDRQNKR